MMQQHIPRVCLTSNILRASEITTGEYARRLIVAEQLVILGCKWPMLHERLGIRMTDAQRLMSENTPEGFIMSRVETGINWFKKSGSGNLRMLHATFLFQIYTATEKQMPEANDAEILLYAYRRYKMLITPVVIDNINRAWFMINSLKNKRGFDMRSCQCCDQSYVAIKFMEVAKCPACERNQYIHCSSCQQLIDDPHDPGRNGSRKTYCTSCAETIRKKKRKIREMRKRIYIPSAALR